MQCARRPFRNDLSIMALGDSINRPQASISIGCLIDKVIIEEGVG